jgi:hypothetical protein
MTGVMYSVVALLHSCALDWHVIDKTGARVQVKGVTVKSATLLKLDSISRVLYPIFDYFIYI